MTKDAEFEGYEGGQPAQQTPYYTPPNYPSLDPAKSGSYKFVSASDDPSRVVGVVWTDFSDATGVLAVDIKASEMVLLQQLISDLAGANLPANSAYVVVDNYVSTVAERIGLLQDAMDAATYLLEHGEIPKEPKDGNAEVWDD